MELKCGESCKKQSGAAGRASGAAVVTFLVYPLRAVESFESDGAFDGIKSWPKAATLIVPITMLQIAKNSQLASVKRESVSIA